MSPVKKQPMNETTLARKALRAELLAKEARAASDAAKKAKDEVLHGMQQLGIKAIEKHVTDGEDNVLVRISLAEPESTVYHEDKIMAAIRRKDPDLLASVCETHVVLDHAKLLTAVQKGTIPLRVVSRNTEVVPRTPYVTITLKGE